MSVFESQGRYKGRHKRPFHQQLPLTKFNFLNPFLGAKNTKSLFSSVRLVGGPGKKYSKLFFLQRLRPIYCSSKKIMAFLNSHMFYVNRSVSIYLLQNKIFYLAKI